MKLESKYFNSSKLFILKRLGVTSGASRNTSIFRNRLPLQFTHKKLLLKHKWFSGRNSTGRIVVFSKGSKTTNNKAPFVNYSFRDKSISIIAGFFLTPFRNKINSLVFSSSGSISYVPTPQTHEVLRFTRFNSLFSKTNRFHKFIILLRPQAFITHSFFLMHSLPKNLPVSLLELIPSRGIQYVRSTGSKAIILKMDTRTSAALVKLSSGVLKIFSIYSIASKGNVCLKENKKTSNSSAGYYSKQGNKPCVRGVAMNPVDHPHGGRAKSVKYQRTPWGKTTKFK